MYKHLHIHTDIRLHTYIQKLISASTPTYTYIHLQIHMHTYIRTDKGTLGMGGNYRPQPQLRRKLLFT